MLQFRLQLSPNLETGHSEKNNKVFSSTQRTLGEEGNYNKGNGFDVPLEIPPTVDHEESFIS